MPSDQPHPSLYIEFCQEVLYVALLVRFMGHVPRMPSPLVWCPEVSIVKSAPQPLNLTHSPLRVFPARQAEQDVGQIHVCSVEVVASVLAAAVAVMTSAPLKDRR